jgi:hypothetical protein
MEQSDYERYVIQVLENPNYPWRTVTGISSELNIPEKLVGKILGSKSLEKKLIKYQKIEGAEILYTTVKHYREKQSFRNRILINISRGLTTVLEGIKNLSAE